MGGVSYTLNYNDYNADGYFKSHSYDYTNKYEEDILEKSQEIINNTIGSGPGKFDFEKGFESFEEYLDMEKAADYSHLPSKDLAEYQFEKWVQALGAIAKPLLGAAGKQIAGATAKQGLGQGIKNVAAGVGKQMTSQMGQSKQPSMPSPVTSTPGVTPSGKVPSPV